VTAQTIGIFDMNPSPAITMTSLAMPAMDFVVQWSRCGMTADYVADYLAYAFERRDAARSVITTAANELLENAAKFSVDKKTTVRIVGRLRGPAVELEVENVTDAAHAEVLAAAVEALTQGEASRLFSERIESRQRGGLGLIILAKDYAAQLGARIVPADSLGAFTVTVRASIPTDEVEQR
jgi:hypothetical protein